MSDNTSDPAQIERSLDQTRSRLGSHLGELQNRLSPGQVLDDVMRYFRGNEGADFGRSLVANVRSNPLPAALTGVGLVWLMASSQRSTTLVQTSTDPGWAKFGTSRSPAYGAEDHGAMMARLQQAEQGVSRRTDEADDVYSTRLDEVRGKAIGLSRNAQETTASFGQRVRDLLASMQQAVTGSMQDLRDQAGSAASAAGDAATSMGTSVRNTAQGTMQSVSGALSHGSQVAGQAGGNMMTALTESPILLGALGLAAGALLGAFLPQSSQEEAALGDIAGQARDRATNVANAGVERGKEVMQAVVDKGRDSAQERGLAGGKSAGELVVAALSGSLASDAKAVVQEVLQTGDEAVRKAAAPSGAEKTGQSMPSPKQTS